jgi:hypothetical protein
MVCKDLASIHWIHIELLHVVCKAAKSSFPDFSCASSEGVCNCGNDFWCHHVRPDAESKTLSWEVCLFVYLGTLQMSPGFLETQLRIYYRVYCSACWTGAWDRGRPDGRVLCSCLCLFVCCYSCWYCLCFARRSPRRSFLLCGTSAKSSG